MMFFKKKKETKTYDPARVKPVIRSSICTGEKTAGFQHLENGKFDEVMLIRNSSDLNEFKRNNGIEVEIETNY